MAKRVLQQNAYLLHTRAYSETSLLLDVFTRSHGRISVLAKGARRMKSTFRGILRPFQALLLSWTGKRELQTLIAAEYAANINYLSLDQWLCASYMNELLINMLHKFDPHERLFDIYDQSIINLTENQPSEKILRIFEKHLLAEVGYGLMLSHDVENLKKIQADKQYAYIPNRGPIEITIDNHNADWTISGETLIALNNESLTSPKVVHESKRLLRNLLYEAMRGKTLKSRNVFVEIQQLS